MSLSGNAGQVVDIYGNCILFGEAVHISSEAYQKRFETRREQSLIRNYNRIMATPAKKWHSYSKKDLAAYIAENAGNFDFRLRVNKSVEIPTFKWILKDVSKYFKKMFEKSDVDIIDIEWESVNEIQLTIDYLHTKEPMQMDPRCIVAEFANKFEIKPLMMEIRTFVAEPMSISDFVKQYEQYQLQQHDETNH